MAFQVRFVVLTLCSQIESPHQQTHSPSGIVMPSYSLSLINLIVKANLIDFPFQT